MQLDSTKPQDDQFIGSAWHRDSGSTSKGGDEVDYLLFVDDKATGTVKRKREGFTLTGVEEGSGKWGKGLRYTGPKWLEPLPFVHEIQAHDGQKQF